MVTIELTSASNGVIKRVVDTNHSGGGSQMQVTKVYRIEDGAVDSAEKAYELVTDLLEDLGVDSGGGNRMDLEIYVDWGAEYIPTVEEVDKRIKETRREVAALVDLRKALVDAKSKATDGEQQG